MDIIHKLHAGPVEGKDFVLSDATPDRVGDVVEVGGWDLKNFNRNPIALFNHNPNAPIGKWHNVRADNGALRGRLELAAEGTSPRIDEIRKLVDAGILRATSVGFRSIDDEPINEKKPWDGTRFKKQELVEASLVAVPANANALAMAKSLGMSADTLKLCFETLPPDSPGSNAVPNRSDKDKAEIPAPVAKASIMKERKMPKTIAEKISALEATRAAKVAQATKQSETEGDVMTTLSVEEKEAHDTLMAEIKDCDDTIIRLRDIEKLAKESAKPVEPEPEQVIKSNGSSLARVTQVKANIPQYTELWRFLQALAVGKGDQTKSLRFAKHAVKYGTWGNTPEIAELFEHDLQQMGDMISKAAVPSGLTTDSTWASPLIFYQQLVSQFAEYLRPLPIMGRISGWRRVPFNIQIPRATTGTSVSGWVGETAPKPLTSMAFDSLTLRWAKAAVIVVMSDELIRFSSPSAEMVVRDDLTRAMVQFLDTQLIGTAAAVTNVSPAGLLNGVTGITPTGTNMAAFRADVASLLANLFALNLPTAGGHWIMTQTQATKLGLAQNSFGQPVFPGLGPEGGTLMGYPVVTSENISSSTGSPTEGYPIIFVLPGEVLMADDGVTLIDSSNQASVQQDSAPDSPPTASTAYISLWQTNQTALRCERWITWAKRRSGVVQFIDRAKYAE